MPDLAQWTIQVDSSGLDKAGRGFASIPGKAAAAEKSTDQLAQSFRRLAGPIAGIISIGALARTFITVNRAFDKLEATLVTATGSASNARAALGELQKVATKTPDSLRDTVDAFNRLVNYGLDPSERSILSFTNTSAGMGKSLNQLIEAVADAATGEFERLKEFGIKARNQGQTVAFTFRGTTTVVKNSSKEIQGYLRSIGENEFAGAAAERMKTLDGAIVKLGDAWEQLWRTIGQTDAGGLVKDSVGVLKDAIEGLAKFMKSDELARGIKAMRSVFVDFAAAIDKAGGIGAALGKLTAPGTVYESLRQGYNWATGGGPTPREAAAEATRRSLQADLEREYISARIIAGTSGGGKVDLGAFGKGGDSDRKKTAAELAREKAAREKRLKELLEFEKGMALINAAISGRVPRQEEDFEPSGVGYREYLGLETERERLRRETNARVLSAGNAPEDQRQALIDAIYDEEKQKLEAILNAENEKRDALMDGLRTEEEEVQHSYDQRLKTIQDAVKQGIIFEEEGMDIVAKLREKQAEDERQRNLALIQNSAAAGEALFGNLAEAAKNAGGVQSAAYKRLFALSQTFAIASATSSMFTGIAKGLEAGWPAGIPLMIGAAATGAGIISQISALKFAGAYDAGGFIPAGKFGIVGEKRPELIQGPANVVGGAQTAQIMGGRPNIAVYVAPDANQAMSFARSSHNEQAFLVFAQKNKTMLRRLLLS